MILAKFGISGVSRAAIVVVVLFVATSCKTPSPFPEGAPDATASPQASAMPAPLAAPTTIARAVAVATLEHGMAPVSLRGDMELPPDTLGREGSGYTLSAVLKQSDSSGPSRAPEVSASGLEAARKRTELRLAIDLLPARMRVTLLGNGWVLPADSELRARADRYGHVFVWPGAATYRPLAPGTLRALLGERRFDVAPITPADVVSKDELGKRIGIRTRKIEVSTRAAKATFEIGRLPDLGEGGVLLCRLLLDLMNAPPEGAVCAEGELPVRAELRWTARGAIGFELTGVLKKTEMPIASLMVPPASASFATEPLPGGVRGMLTPPELAALRTGPIDVPNLAHVSEPDLTVMNATDELRVLYLDGVAAAWAAPGAKDVLHGLVRGRYVGQWRTFLGESFEAPTVQIVPGLALVGAAPADAGAR